MTLDVIPPAGADLPAMLNVAAAELITTAKETGLTLKPRAAKPGPADDAESAVLAGDGRFTLHVTETAGDDGEPVTVKTVTQQRDGRSVPVRATPELTDLIEFRDAVVPLFAAEADRAMSANRRNRIRQHAFQLYQQYTANHGYLNRSDLSAKPDPDGLPGDLIWTRRRPSMDGFRADPDYPTVLAAELWDDEEQAGGPAPILLRHVNHAAERKTRTDDPAEALLLCLDETARVDLAVIGRLLDVPAAAVPGMLGDLIFDDPDGGWVAADEYTAGDVRAKLAAAKRAAAADPERYGRHVTALTAVQPAELGPAEINAQLGSPWIPAGVVAEFIRAALGVSQWETDKGTLTWQVRVRFIELTSAWEVRAGENVRKQPAAGAAKWGTLRVNAVNLIEQALNGAAPVVYDTAENGAKAKNEEETQLAADKIRDLQETFTQWLWSEPKRAARLCDIYNDRFNCLRVRRYDGTLLTFPGWGAEFDPYQSQRDMTWRSVCTPAALCGYDVGAGKTATMIMTAMTLRRLGLAKKPCMIVPNHLLEQETAEARRLFPGARILMVTREDLTRDRRKAFAAKCAAQDLDLILMTHQQFYALQVDPEVERAFIAAQIEEIDWVALDESLEDSRTAKQLAAKRRRLESRHEELLDAVRDGGVTFEQTGIDYLLVDEAHFFKNLGMSARAEGFSLAGSKRADDLAMKIGWLRDTNAGGRCASLYTGTPISNSLAELHVLFRYLDPAALTALGLASFDGFAAQYIRYSTTTEVAPDGSGFRSYRRPAAYCNLPELRRMLGQVADIRSRTDLKLDGPEVEVRHVKVDAQPELAPYTARLVWRADEIRQGGVNPKDDNMLKVCTDGRRAALDLRLLGIEPTGPGKVKKVAAQVAGIYADTALNLYPDPSGRSLFHGRAGGFQLVFCDLGTPGDEHGDQVYGWLRDEMTAAGIPRDRIAFIHDAKTREARSALFARCRTGEINVLIASTEMAGTGVNIQHRMVAIHHVDAPWRPADLLQRDGRGDRPGNWNDRLLVFRYATERSFDAYMWQALTRKQKFIEQVLTGDLDIREVEAVGSLLVLGFGEMAAISSGQPLMMELAQVNAEIARLRNQAAAHTRSQTATRYDWDDAREHAARQCGLASELEKITEIAAESRRAIRTAAGGQVTGDEMAGYVEATLRSARSLMRKADLGWYRGVAVSFTPVYVDKDAPPVRVSIESHYYSGHAWTWTVRPGVWRKGGAALMLAELDAVIDTAAATAAECRAEGGQSQARADELKPYLGQEWPHKTQLAGLREVRLGIEAAIDAQVTRGKADVMAEPAAVAA